ncbi:hypothetical protein HDU97_009437 [Phlyctochytrium planicorne]|nr:hypothetical protein HDU97_009437 [Phlyctochytrium planicorne]
MSSMTSTNPSTVWEDFKTSLTNANPAKAAACFSPNAALVCIPTGGGSDGSSASLLAFLKAMTAQEQDLHVEREVLSLVATPRMLVEEAILTLVHSETLNWLLPDVKPTRKRITFPLISFVDFGADGKIQSLRLHWDQATVLRQITVLPNSLFCKSNSSETVLPVLGPRIVDRLKFATGLSGGEENGLNVNTSADPEVESQPTSAPTSARGRSSGMTDILAGKAAPDAVRPSSRVLQRPGGQISDIFSTEPPTPRASIPVDPRRFVQQVNLFEEVPLPAVTAAATKKPEPVDDGVAAAGGTDRGASSGRRFYPGRDASTLQFGDASSSSDAAAVPPPAAAPAPFATGNEFVQAAGSRSSVTGRHNLSSITFGGPEPVTSTVAPVAPDDTLPAAGVVMSVERGGNANVRPGSGYGGMRDRNEQSKAPEQRPSSRVLGPPGGKSNIFIG